MDKEKLCTLIKQHPKSHFIIDESHLLFNKEFDNMSMKNKVENFPNLTVVLSLSKFLNVPGIRMGAVISNPLIIEKFKTQNVPYYINKVSTKILKDNITDKENVIHVREELFDIKKKFYEQLKDIVWLETKHNEYNNFFICRIVDKNLSARKLERFLSVKGMTIRLCE